MTALAVLGAGAWGTAIAVALSQRHKVALWARDAAQAASLSQTRRNQRYLAGIEIPPAVTVTADLQQAIGQAGLLLTATPVAGLRELLGRLRGAPPVIWLCKGFEEGSGRLPHEIAEEVLGKAQRCGVLSGPSFAEEVARGLPCALTLAARDASFARETAAALHGGRLRVYYSADVTGVELAGALKNVIAIAAGICDGLQLGQNARAALVTRGLAEIARLGAALGGAAETFMGLSGVGDLFLTTSGDLSRNRRVGLELARGRALAQILEGLGHVAEGARSAREAARLAKAHRVEVPITDAVNAVLEGQLSAPQAVETLLARDPRREH